MGVGGILKSLNLWSILIKSGSPGLWAILLCKMIEGCSYMMCSLTMKQYLVDNFGFTDVDAGYTYGLWGLATTLYGLMLGVVIDKVGIRWSLLTGGILLSISRMWLALTLNKEAMLFNLYFLLPIGMALGMPVKLIAVKRYTASVVGPVAYGLLYLVLNAGYFFAGFIVDGFRENFQQSYTTVENGKTVEYNTPQMDVDLWDQMTAYRWISVCSACLTVVFLVIAIFFVHDLEVVWVDEKGHTVARGCRISKETDKALEEAQKKGHAQGDFSVESLERIGGGWSMAPYRSNPSGNLCKIMGDLGSDASFWLFLLLVSSVLGVRMLFRHLDATFPQYMERELGDDIKLGMVFSMNPLAVVIFTLVVSILLTHGNIIWIMVFGMAITALSPLWLMFGAYYWTGVLFMVTMAAGEAIWMPRFYELSLSKTCPDGEEGIFSALTNAPTFFVKFLAGVISGYLLDTYCPEEGKRDSATMWLIITVISFSSPLILAILQVTGVWDMMKDMKSSNEKTDKVGNYEKVS